MICVLLELPWSVFPVLLPGHGVLQLKFHTFVSPLARELLGVTLSPLGCRLTSFSLQELTECSWNSTPKVVSLHTNAHVSGRKGL